MGGKRCFREAKCLPKPPSPEERAEWAFWNVVPTVHHPAPPVHRDETRLRLSAV